MTRPWVIGALAAVCAVVAFAIPTGAWVDEIFVVEQVDMSSQIKVEADGERMLIHAPDGYVIQGWGSNGVDEVGIRMTGPDGFVSVQLEPGAAPEELTITDGAVTGELVRGARITAFSRRVPVEVLAEIVNGVEHL